MSVIVGNGTIKSSLDPVFGLRQRAVGAHAILDGDDAGFILAQRRINDPLLCCHMSMDDSMIFFFNSAAFQDFSQLARHDRIFRHDHHAAGLTVEAVDEVGLGES